MIDNGMDVNAKAEGGRTPLHVSAEYGKFLFLQKNIRYHLSNNLFNSFSILLDHPNLATLLIAGGANVNDRTRNNNTALHVAVSLGRIASRNESRRKF